MINRLAGLVLAGLVVAACGASGGPSPVPGGSSGAPVATSAPATAATPSSAPGSSGAAASAYCGLFTVDEVKGFLGTGVDAGEDAALGTGCQWTDGSGEAMLQVQVIDDPSYFVAETGADGYKELAGIGEEAFSVPGLAGAWSASARTAKSTYYATVRGANVSEETAVDLLKALMARR